MLRGFRRLPRGLGHPPPVPRHEHPGLGPVGAMARHLNEFVRMGASPKDLHQVIEAMMARHNQPWIREILQRIDPGQGSVDAPISPSERIHRIITAYTEEVEAWKSTLSGKGVIVAGEVPPHFLEHLLVDRPELVQIHPLTHEGDQPPHFRHLEKQGLRGVTDFHGLAGISCDIVLFHGYWNSTHVYVSQLVPIVKQMFPAAQLHLLTAFDRHPHMVTALQDEAIVYSPVLV